MMLIAETARLFPLDQVQLLEGELKRRYDLNRSYVMSLTNRNLLQNYLLEAGLLQGIFRASSHGDSGSGDDWHWGWESPECQLRGHFLGHWLSAAARMVASTSSPRRRVTSFHSPSMSTIRCRTSASS